MHRQGDILIFPATSIPATAKAVEREGGKVILARGEVTGHHHAIQERDVELFAPGEAAELADLFLRVGSGGATVTHQEHAPIALPPGDYLVRRQREYQPKALPRQVAD